MQKEMNRIFVCCTEIKYLEIILTKKIKMNQIHL